MKDNIMRITSAEKKLITELRNLNAFEMKDLVNEIKNLIVITKLTEQKHNYRHIEIVDKTLNELQNERENEALQKIERKKNRTTSKKQDCKYQEDDNTSNTSIKKIKNAVDKVSAKTTTYHENTESEITDNDSDEEIKKFQRKANINVNELNEGKELKQVQMKGKPESDSYKSSDNFINTPIIDKLKARKFKSFLHQNSNNTREKTRP